MSHEVNPHLESYNNYKLKWRKWYIMNTNQENVIVRKYADGLYGIKTNLNTNELLETCFKMKSFIEENFIFDSESSLNGQNALNNYIFTKYNLLLYPFPGIHELYWNIHKAFHICLTHHFGIVPQKFVTQCWLNFYNYGECIDWHKHFKPNVNAWHGFVCVYTEPNSYTSYRWPDDDKKKDFVLDIPSEDGLIVLGLSNGDEHKSSIWFNKNHPRITIAFDVVPTDHIYNDYLTEYPSNSNNGWFFNHWMPI